MPSEVALESTRVEVGLIPEKMSLPPELKLVPPFGGVPGKVQSVAVLPELLEMSDFPSAEAE